jgi:hypothetical protein
MPSDQPLQLDAVDQRGLGVRVAFHLVGDRYGHTLSAVRGDQIAPLLSSVEDVDQQGWPLSPPVQEIREVADAEGARTLLLIGAAAHGHWSAGVRSFKHNVAGHFLEFDVAVRLTRLPSHLGAAYELAEGARWINLPAGQVYAAQGDAELAVMASLDDAVAASKRPSELLKSSLNAGHPQRRTFCPDFSQLADFPATFRWKYWVGLTRA